MSIYEPGRYTAKVINQGFGVERKGTEFFYMTVRPLQRVYDDYSEDASDHGDRDVKMHLTEKTIDFQLEILRSLGWYAADFEDLFSGTHSFVGLEVDVICDQREYKGKYYDQFSISNGAAREVSEVSSLTAKFADKLRKTSKADAPKRTITPDEAKSIAAAADPDNIPF